MSRLIDALRARGGRPQGDQLVWGRRAAREALDGPAPRGSSPAAGLPPRADQRSAAAIDLEPRRRKLAARVAELQWDLGGLVYEMAIRDRIRIDVLVQRAAALQEVDSELAEVERLLRLEHAGAAGSCTSCGALHSRGAAYCWQCGHALVDQVPSQAIAGHRDR